jgi:2-methylcitrate dehydratase PrpD
VRTDRLNPTSSLIDYIVVTTPDKVPAKALLAARDIMLDTVGAMLGACAPRYSTARLIAAYARAEGGHPRASVVGQGFKSGPCLAALANGTLAYALDIESIHGPSITHAAAVVVPAVLAVAEDAGRTGAETLTAVVVGLDAADRLSRALTPRDQYARGLHPSEPLRNCWTPG